MPHAPRRPSARRLLATILTAGLAACGGSGGGSPGGDAAPPRASEEEWRALATPRVQPLDGAPRVAVEEMEVAGEPGWSTPAGVSPALGLTELMAAGLLRRQDVDFVERRRFAAAAEAERRGQPRPEGAPAAGISRGAQYVAKATWSRIGPVARLDVRLSDAATAQVVAVWRTQTPTDADVVALARGAVAGTLAALDSLGVRPQWADPATQAAPTRFQASGVAHGAAASFFQGLAAEERWRWEEARRGYQDALAVAGGAFVEAEAALARTARLRNGGTLGAS